MHHGRAGQILEAGAGADAPVAAAAVVVLSLSFICEGGTKDCTAAGRDCRGRDWIVALSSSTAKYIYTLGVSRMGSFQ